MYLGDNILPKRVFLKVLLVLLLGIITEVRRHHSCFVEETEIVTPPANKFLMGITRQKTINIARELDIQVTEREVSFSELSAFGGAFISGTSPKILPIIKIDAFKFDPKNEIVVQLIKRYDELVGAYIKENIK